MCLISFIIHGLFQLSFPPPKTFLLTLTLSDLVPGSSNVKRETGYTTVLNALIAAIKASSPRYAALLQLAADKAGWPSPRPHDVRGTSLCTDPLAPSRRKWKPTSWPATATPQAWANRLCRRSYRRWGMHCLRSLASGSGLCHCKLERDPFCPAVPRGTPMGPCHLPAKGP